MEDAFLTTENPSGTGSLLMFRDSFGNTLLPLFAQSCRSACFSKATPYQLEKYLTAQTPDTVIVEKVERNLADFAADPPIMTAPAVPREDAVPAPEAEARMQAKIAPSDVSFVMISGSVAAREEYDEVFVQVGETLYRAFLVTEAGDDCCFRLYLPKDLLEPEFDARLLIREEAQLYEISTFHLTIQEAF